MAKSIPVRWLSALALTPALFAQGPQMLALSYRESPTPERRTALERYAAAHAQDINGALARLALGITAYEQKDWSGAERNLEGAEARLPKLADYVAFYRSAARVEGKSGTVTVADLAPALAANLSPLAGKAVVVEARALAAAGLHADAIGMLRARYTELPQPDGDMALASSYEAASDLPSAAAWYQQVYYGYPYSDAVTPAGAALVALRDRMGASYPQPPPKMLLARADKFLASRDCTRAKAEYRAIASQAQGLERDQARVRVGASDFVARDTASAYQYLRTLDVGRSEADAERLYYILECARRLNDDDQMMEAVERLGAHYPDSPWRLRGLISAANRFLVANQPDRYIPLYRTAYEVFPKEPQAATCHWKVAWNAYLYRKPEALPGLKKHLEQFPSHPTATAALYFAGRLAERDGRYGDARAFYARLADLFPNYYYGLMARERLKQKPVAAAAVSAQASDYLTGAGFKRPLPATWEPTGATTSRIARSRLLRSAGLADLAGAELRFGAKKDGQPALLALEAARGADSASQRLRAMKTYSVDYLAVPLDAAPRQFWEYLFPLPYRTDLVRNARLQNLDPYTVAGLIRQESEFNPQALSHANAYGLTQVMPGTGRQLARRVGIRRFSNRMLFQPAVNLRLGTFYMRSLLDKWGGKWEPALASYNAGPNRAGDWIAWRAWEEPAEFVESIPYSETRDYVQAVLRNAAVYRQLYADRAAVSVADTAPKKPAKQTASGKKRARRG